MRKQVWTTACIVMLASTVAIPTAWAQQGGTGGASSSTRELPSRDRSQSRSNLPIAVNISYGVTGDGGAAGAGTGNTGNGPSITSSRLQAGGTNQPANAAARRERRSRLANRQAGISDTPAGPSAPATIETDSQSSLVGQQVQKGGYNNVVDGLMYGDDQLADQVAIAEDYVAECDGYYGYGGGLPAVTGGISVVPPDGLPPLIIDDLQDASSSSDETEQD